MVPELVEGSTDKVKKKRHPTIADAFIIIWIVGSSPTMTHFSGAKTEHSVKSDLPEPT